MRQRKAAAGPPVADDAAVPAATRAVPARDAQGRFLKTGTAVVVGQQTRGVRPATGRGTKAGKAPGWSARRERIFLATLAETANVTASARAAGISESTVYRKRRESEDFRVAWAAALREGVCKLETMLLHRALNGVRKAVWHGGKRVGTMIEYSDRTALALLAMHRTGGGGTAPREAQPPPVPIEELRAQLKAKLSEMNKRMGGAG